ncbi:hypothetical protein TrCOL_g13075 [Triparma columacea]|nr:hypothetical protein TrCOL_g13075 [Triparma columacea]
MSRKQESVALITDHLSDVREKYHIQPKELGHGHYGVVRKCQERESGAWFAIKSIRKKKVGKIDVLKREIDILKEVTHPNIINLHEVYEDEKYLHLVTELCTGGELFDRIIAKTQSKEGHFSEHDAAEIIKEIIEAIAYCHDVKHICHRDLKPENFLFETPDEHSKIKIIDFGLSRHEDTGPTHMMKTKVGTPYYVAPEVLNKEYDKSCDMWSIGVITYILLCGYPPFYGDNDHEIFASVRAAQYDYPSPEWDGISGKAKDFIDHLLKKDPKARLTAANALDHPWFSDLGVVDKSTLPKIKHGGSVNTEFRKYMAMSKLKKAALAHIATHLTNEEVKGLKEVFQAIDVDSSGTLTVEEIKDALANGGFTKNFNAELESIMDSLDVEGHHELNWEDFVSATIDKSTVMQEDKIRMAFHHFDRTNRGSISVKDLAGVFGSEHQAKEVMKDVDFNGDGVISYEEFHAMMEADADK